VIDFTDAPLSEHTGRNIGLKHDAAFTALAAVLVDPRVASLTITELNPDHGEPDGSTIGKFADALVRALSLLTSNAKSALASVEGHGRVRPYQRWQRTVGDPRQTVAAWLRTPVLSAIRWSQDALQPRLLRQRKNRPVLLAAAAGIPNRACGEISLSISDTVAVDHGGTGEPW
jgi:hypothetical protein